MHAPERELLVELDHRLTQQIQIVVLVRVLVDPDELVHALVVRVLIAAFRQIEAARAQQLEEGRKDRGATDAPRELAVLIAAGREGAEMALARHAARRLEVSK